MPKKNLEVPMVEKVRIQEPEENESMLSMIVGTVLVALGILLFVVGIVMFVLYYLPPREDVNIPKPTLYQLPNSSNKTTITLSGEAQTEKVMIWVNEELVNSGLKVTDSKYNYDYLVSKEGDYKIEIAALKGFPIRLRSEKTTPVTVAIDWSPPSKNVAFVYTKEIDTKTFNISGTIDANTKITLKSSANKEYSTVSDSAGKFFIKDIPVKEGGNEYSVILADNAGNTTRIDETVKVIYASGQINGNGAKVLPESAGLLSNEIAYVLGNKLFILFGLLALGLFASNGAIVYKKLSLRK